MRVVIAIQARLGSSRLPNKALVDLGGRPLICQLLRRLRAVRFADAVVVACPEKDASAFRAATSVHPITGPEEDVLTRILNVADQLEADKIVRVGADCPLVPPDGIEAGIKICENKNLVQNWKPRIWPDGFDFDIWDVGYLRQLSMKYTNGDREWFASKAASENPGTHMRGQYRENLSKWRLTVDYPEDLEVVRAIYEDMGSEVWGAGLVLQWCATHPREMKKNAHHVKDFGARPK